MGCAAADETATTQIIYLEFKDRDRAPNRYTVTTTYYPPEFAPVMSWVVEGSNDGVQWKEIDRRVRVRLSQPVAVASFDTRNSNNRFRMVRMRPTNRRPPGFMEPHIAGIDLELEGL